MTSSAPGEPSDFRVTIAPDPANGLREPSQPMGDNPVTVRGKRVDATVASGVGESAPARSGAGVCDEVGRLSGAQLIKSFYRRRRTFMMKDSDLQIFVSLFREVEREDQYGPFCPPSRVLEFADGLFCSEIWRLSRSLRIGVAAGETPAGAAIAADHIWDDLREKRVVPFSCRDEWKKAIQWAVSAGSPQFTSVNVEARQQNVGEAAAALRRQGFKISLGAYGLEFSATAQREIFRKAESLSALLGGVEVLMQLCDFMAKSNKIHDGMWLLGDKIPNLYETKSPTHPLGWLFALGVKYIGSASTARKPEVAWKSLIELATNMAACLDCERYNQFEGINMQPTEFWLAMNESLHWREFFTVPQVPSVALKRILAVLTDVVAQSGEQDLAAQLKAFVVEALSLSELAQADRLGKIPQAYARSRFPNLTKTAAARAMRVNVGIKDIFSSENRDHERLVLFETADDHFVFLPTPILNAALCEIAFTKVWQSVPNIIASKIVGATFEKVLGDACRGKTPILVVNEKYIGVDRKRLEMDIGSREGVQIVLFETKAKSLTIKSRQSGGFAYISDYTKSYLAIIKQLMLHEKSIRFGLGPLVCSEEKYDDLRPLKVAVSPLSYGQLSDKMFASSIIRGLFNVNLVANPGQDTPENNEIIDKFNTEFANIKDLVIELAPKRNGLAELAPYFIDFFWVDLGQAVYILDRSSSVVDAFSPLKHITYTTRDFWTEVAIADRGGYTRGKWSLVGQSVTPVASP